MSDLNLLALVPSTNIGPLSGTPRWLRKGPTWESGNYVLQYSAARHPSNRRWLQFEGTADGDRIRVTSLPGAPIGRAALEGILRVLASRDAWSGTGRKLRCQLVETTEGGTVAQRSGFVEFIAPVRPWTKKLDADEFVRDGTIRYCSVHDTEGNEFFVGRELVRIEPFGYLFVFNGVLETDPRLRGFACIGFVANMLGAPLKLAAGKDAAGKAVSISTRAGGAGLAAVLNGNAFDWAERPTKNVKFETKDLDVDGTLFDKAQGYVSMGPGLFKAFVRSPAARTGTYVVWTGSHCGMVRNGALYECKPTGRGWTPSDTFVPGEQSAVRRWQGAGLDRIIKQVYHVSLVQPRI